MIVENLGLKDYKEVEKIQEDYVEKLRDDTVLEKIIFCSHESVVTLGKKTIASDLGNWQGATYKVARGGSVTYHGPAQIICYPLIRLRKRNNDIHKYLRALETSLVQTLESYGVTAHGDENSTGVWVGIHKIASIGIAIRRGITYHGLALNLNKDPNAFSGINPCGMRSDTMISLEEILECIISRHEFEKKLESFLLVHLDFS